MGFAIFHFHCEYNVFWIGPIFPLYNCPREYWPLIHFLATSLSAHGCTGSPSSRVWMVLSAGRRTLVALSSTLFFHLVVVSIVEWFTLCNAKETHLFLSSVVWHHIFLQAQSALPVRSTATLPRTHPRLCQLHMCFLLV